MIVKSRYIGFCTTPYSQWKVFFWAIVHSEFGVEDCFFALQFPVAFWRWQRYRQLVFRLPVTVYIPPYLIAEYGKRVVGSENWDEEIISTEEESDRDD